MVKNWLIRTKNNHILGPLSKDKVRELYYSNSIKPEDEICSGNGYWFFLKEKNLVEKYLIGDDKQGFSIVSEAQSVLTLDHIDFPIEEHNQETQEDPGVSQSDILNVVPDLDDLEYPNLEENLSEMSSVRPELNHENELKKSINNFESKIIENKVKTKSDRFLYFVALLFLAFAVFAFLYRKTIIGQFMTQVNILSPVYAEDFKTPTELLKKNSIIKV